MADTSQIFGFRYRFDGRNYALDVQADSREEAEARVAAMAAAEFLTVLHPRPEPTQDMSGLQTNRP